MTNRILGVRFDNFTIDEFVDLVVKEIEAKKKFRIALSNPEFLLQARSNPQLKNYLNSIEFNVADGIGVVLASRLLHHYPLKERITGTDMLPRLVEKAKERGLTFYFLGGKPGVAEKAKQKFLEKFGYEGVVGLHHGYLDENMESVIIDEIRLLKPDILMVCLGNPKQEKWIQDNFHLLEARLIFGNGGALDYYSNNVKRAPLWFQENGLEWLFRLTQDFSWVRIKRQSKLLKFPFLILFDFVKQGLKKEKISNEVLY
jgi:N-acetylglucosaminyldiphosphoundecaprenol N-acetyl-beta-D-mannosaminyltransferase